MGPNFKLRANVFDRFRNGENLAEIFHGRSKLAMFGTDILKFNFKAFKGPSGHL